jgi:predicted AAA+ superfamily ATPase
LEYDRSSLATYLAQGGFPNYIDDVNPEYLQQLVRDIIYRDIVVRYGVRNSRVVEEICLYLLSNVGKEYSLNRLKKVFSLGSASSVADYLSWMQDSYLLYSLPRFSYSAKAVSVNPKKIYAVDTGLVRANSLSYSDDNGRLLENAVYMHLRRSYRDLYYYKDRGECDFLVRDGIEITTALQVCLTLHPDNIDREVNGLLEAMDAFSLDSGYIITMDQTDELQAKGKSIKVIPAYRLFVSEIM